MAAIFTLAMIQKQFKYPSDNELIMIKLLDACKKWAKENDAEFRGLLYIFIKFVVPNAKSSMFYYDVWLPLR